MNKQEFQQKMKNMKRPKFFTAITINEAYEEGFEEAKNNALFNSFFLDEPEKPVVPQFIDAWIQAAKNNGFDLYEAMTDNGMSDNVSTWIVYNSETFAKAWIYGYEVEKEKLYTVGLPNPNGDSNRYGLCKVDGRIVIGSFVLGLTKAINTKLTEAEIKEDFEWAWQFAKEVDE